MTIILWSTIILCFILSFIGLIYPVIPSVLMVWSGVLIYHFLIDSSELSTWLWVVLGVLTILLMMSDFLANAYFVKKYGGSKWGSRIATLGLIVGSFIFPPFGVLIVPFVFVLIAEWIRVKELNKAIKVALGILVAFLSGTVAKGLIQLWMIILFIMDLILW